MDHWVKELRLVPLLPPELAAIANLARRCKADLAARRGAGPRPDQSAQASSLPMRAAEGGAAGEAASQAPVRYLDIAALREAYNATGSISLVPFRNGSRHGYLCQDKHEHCNALQKHVRAIDAQLEFVEWRRRRRRL
jgi:hypothetical protein